MNMNFSENITLIRKENGLSQKEAAEKLNISQALLSHYERGIRECGLEFLVKIADFYSVSCDYLLGRTAIRQISKNKEIGENENKNKREIINCIGIIYDIAARTQNNKINSDIHMILSLYLYHILRLFGTFSIDKSADFFSVPCERALLYVNLHETIVSNRITSKLNGELTPESKDILNDCICLTEKKLHERYPLSANSLLGIINEIEGKFKII